MSIEALGVFNRALCALAVGAGFLLVAAGAAHASLINQTHIDYWTGAGNQQAVMVVDFGAQSYAFGYRWDQSGGQTTAWDMLSAIDDGGALAFTAHDYGGSLGESILSISYEGKQIPGGEDGGWIAEWASTDGLTWTSPFLGPTSLVLDNNDWIGWSAENWMKTALAIHTPDVPMVPEPASGALVFLGLGGVLIWRRRRRVSGRVGNAHHQQPATYQSVMPDHAIEVGIAHHPQSATYQCVMSDPATEVGIAHPTPTRTATARQPSAMNNPHRSLTVAARSGRQAFTLIEVLTVISIIALLINLLLPALSQAREAGRAVACMSHQRQMTMALLAYTHDHDGYFMKYAYRTNGGVMWWFGFEPGSTGLPSGGARPLDVRRSPLAAYLGGDIDHALACPDFPSDSSRFFKKFNVQSADYGYNGGIVWPFPFGRTPHRLRDVRTPSKVFAFADALFQDGPATFSEPVIVSYRRPGRITGTAHYRHNGRANVAYLDGHVATLKPPATERIWDVIAGAPLANLDTHDGPGSIYGFYTWTHG